MTIELDKVSKRYTEEWILKHITLRLESDQLYGIKGANGSGKSTLVKMLSGHLSPSRGSIRYYTEDMKEIPRDDVFRMCTMWGPHVDLISNLTVDEMVRYFFTYKSLRAGLSLSDFYDIILLPIPRQRLIKSMSSGQVQRLGLGLTILADSDLLILDEPGSFLDEFALQWFYDLFNEHISQRIVIVASNDRADLALTSEVIDIGAYK